MSAISTIERNKLVPLAAPMAASRLLDEKARAQALQAAKDATLLSKDKTLTDDQRRARAAESNVRAVAPRYQGTGLAQMFGAQGVASTKTNLGQ